MEQSTSINLTIREQTGSVSGNTPQIKKTERYFVGDLEVTREEYLEAGGVPVPKLRRFE